MIVKERYVLIMSVVSILFVCIGCSALLPLEPTPTPIQPTETPVPPTETPVPPTETPVPKGKISGQVYLLDREEPVQTLVRLVLKEGNEEVDSMRTDEDGWYSFDVDDPGVYHITVSVKSLLDKCEGLRSETGGWIASQVYGPSGLTDVQAMSMPILIQIEDELTNDLYLYCDK